MVETTTHDHQLALPGGATAPIAVRRSPRARRIILRVIEDEPGIELVVPRRVSLREAFAFAREKAAWVADRLAERPPSIAFAPGTQVPYHAGDLALVPRNGKRAEADRAGAMLFVSGPDTAFSDTVTRWLREDARTVIRPRASRMAAQLNRKARRIRIGDPATRWGSCSSTGTLSFSWRLVMAPAPVLEYVIAHEVAHLAELNHGPRFWETVEVLVGDSAGPRTWLREHGATLRRYGRAA